MSFKPATRTRARARVAIDGPAKAGKSFTALRLAHAIGGRIAAVDTEFGSLSKYAGAAPDGEGPFAFDVLELTQFAPTSYIAAIHDAERAGYQVLVIDSLSHAWVGEGGILDQADRKQGGNSFTKWADLTPQHRKLVDAILATPMHVIATMRSKQEYVLEPDAKGKMVPRKVGLAPVQREGMEYEFDLLCSVDQEHTLRVSGSRCPGMDGAIGLKPGAAFFRPYVEWLGLGVDAPTPAPSANGHATSDQVHSLRLQCSGLGLTDEQVRGRLTSLYGVGEIERLTKQQADEIGAKLRDALAAKTKSEAAQVAAQKSV